MLITSQALEEGQSIPLRYTKDGENIAPPIGWEDLPEGTRELVVLFEQVTPSTRQPFVQWLAYRIPADAPGLAEGIRHRRETDEPPGVLQGRNSIGNLGYDGPLGTVGRTMHYRLRLFALDCSLDVPPGLGREDVFEAMQGHVIGEAELNVHYQRPP